jgi:hypothetical protein
VCCWSPLWSTSLRKSCRFSLKFRSKTSKSLFESLLSCFGVEYRLKNRETNACVRKKAGYTSPQKLTAKNIKEQHNTQMFEKKTLRYTKTTRKLNKLLKYACLLFQKSLNLCPDGFMRRKSMKTLLKRRTCFDILFRRRWNWGRRQNKLTYVPHTCDWLKSTNHSDCYSAIRICWENIRTRTILVPMIKCENLPTQNKDLQFYDELYSNSLNFCFFLFVIHLMKVEILLETRFWCLKAKYTASKNQDPTLSQLFRHPYS